MGNVDENFDRFTTEEMMRHLGLYMLNGIAPSPRVEQKFYTQGEDPANGNNMCAAAFGGYGKGIVRHKEVKKYLAFVDPRKLTPLTKVALNRKVESLLCHIIDISREAMCIGKWISIDKQTLGFKGRCIWKIRINYKKEGYGFQCDAICADGYIFSFFSETKMLILNLSMMD